MTKGETPWCDGFFTKAFWLRMQTSAELERRLGYRTGRMNDGWYLLFLLQMPTPDQFEFRGYSYLSGGVAQGHLANPPDRRNVEQQMRDEGKNLPQIKQRIIQDVFRLDGPERLAKVIPKRDPFGADDYPAGSGIAQWKLTTPLPFKVVDFFAPGQTYTGFYT